VITVVGARDDQHDSVIDYLDDPYTVLVMSSAGVDHPILGKVPVEDDVTRDRAPALPDPSAITRPSARWQAGSWLLRPNVRLRASGSEYSI